MQRLCGRPGCSDPATVAYGMRAEDLVFWLDVLADDPDRAPGGLCGRHADTMVVPRGWTLDDLRDPDLHLFRPPMPSPAQPEGRAVAQRGQRRRPPSEQLRFGVDGEPVSAGEPVEVENERETTHDTGDGGAQQDPWSPSFDEADDLDGLLSASSPLLSRAFRTAGRDPR